MTRLRVLGRKIQTNVTMRCQQADNTIIRQYRSLNSLTLQTLPTVCIAIYNTPHRWDPFSGLVFPTKCYYILHVLHIRLYILYKWFVLYTWLFCTYSCMFCKYGCMFSYMVVCFIFLYMVVCFVHTVVCSVHMVVCFVNMVVCFEHVAVCFVHMIVCFKYMVVCFTLSSTFVH
jgi:hypothetical protein